MLKPAQIAEVKARGFLLNRGTENFSGRIVPQGSVFTAEDLRTIAELAENFGGGKVVFTSRLTAEIVGIPFDQIDAACISAAPARRSARSPPARARPASTATTTRRRSPRHCTKNIMWAGRASSCRISSKSASAAARTAA